jgi:hypothetical protein
MEIQVEMVMSTCEGNIRTNVKQVWCESVYWTQWAQDRAAVAGSCEHSLVKNRELHDHLRDMLYLDLHTNTPWSESASELYRPSDRRLSAK